ncbi:MAG: endopeptidase La [Candidatus Poribacteria bacterium]|nr:endopeptidase La [Candidatus Poribacteria bacterium]
MAKQNKDEQRLNDTIKELPVIPVKEDLVIFPYMPPVPPFPPHHIALSGESVTAAVDDAMVDGSRLICIFKLHEDKDKKELKIKDLHPVGSLVHIIKYRKEDENVLFLAQGRARIRIDEIIQTEPFIKARVQIIEEAANETTVESEALIRSVLSLFQKIVELSSRYQEEFSIIAENIDEPGRLADYIAAALNLKSEDKQLLLETVPIKDRLERLIVSLTKELDLLELESKIQSNAQEVINKGQREYFLREQMKAIQDELGETDDLGLEIEEMREQIEKANMPEKAKAAAEKELNRLSQMHASSPESTVSRNYLDWLINLPWDVSTEDRLEISHAKQILDEDHYDLEKVKDRILEYLAVRLLKQDMKGPILCFVGPPGVGKTSLGKSIARAMERKFVRISLGGIHDEAEIRGHRRTYIGSMPGRIVKSLRQAESNNPVFMLDEIDKLGSDFRGDPASALLEVLDPEQNNTFVDNYLDVPFDLSKVMFITTANQLYTIPPALLDRMEVLELPGYTTNEKLMIAKQYLISRQLEAHGINADQLSIMDDAIRQIVDTYTREAGVRNLERELGTICRKVARQVAEGNETPTHVTPADLPDYLGVTKFYSEVAERQGEVGVVTGMSATAYGGEILFVEATRMTGKGKLILTGQIGDVMQESAQAALSYVKSQSEYLHIKSDFFQKNDIHVHVPSGAIPKDGPSAGITIATALASLATGQKVIPDVAMTGEITLRGRVLPIGGLKGKTLAAKQAGIKTVILPQRNQKDLAEVPDDAKDGVEFVSVNHMSEVFEFVFKSAS